MNPFYDMNIKKIIIPKWYRLFLWVLPTYVDIGDDYITYWKQFKTTIFIVKVENVPWKKD